MATTIEATREQSLKQAESLVSVLSERAPATEQARRVPEETIDELVNAGLFRITTPVKWGGVGLDYDVAWEVATILGRGCGSTAWCYMVSQVHSWQVGLSPERTQEEFFITPDQVSSSAPPGPGKVESVDGGWSLSGSWSFSSGVDNAHWVMPSGFTREHGLVMFVIPKSDCRVEDDWHVAGLKGTGSKSIVFDDVFVPGHRYTPFNGATHPEAREIHDRPSYGSPFFSLIPHTLLAPIVGMAEGMVEVFAERMKTRRSLSGRTQADLAPQHLRIADASAMINAARAVARANLAELIERGGASDEFSELDRTRFRRDHSFAARLCVQAANRLYEGSGGTAIYDSNPLQRFHRDIHTASHQVSLDWDLVGELYGRARFGLELEPGSW